MKTILQMFRINRDKIITGVFVALIIAMAVAAVIGFIAQLQNQ